MPNSVRPVKFLGLFPVHYYDEHQGMDFFDTRNSYPAFALKNTDGFSEQKEIRAVWAPIIRDIDITPANLNVADLRLYTCPHQKLEVSGCCAST